MDTRTHKMKKNSLQQKMKLFHPKFWIYWFGLGLLWILIQLPWGIRMKIGDCIGALAFRIFSRRRKIAETNIKAVFSDWDEKSQKALIKSFSHNVGRGFLETGMAWFWPKNKIFKNSELIGDEHSIKLLEDPDAPVILIGSHSTVMELGARILGNYFDCAGIYRPMTHPFFGPWIRYQRAKSATHLMHFKEMRSVINCLKNGDNVWYALDQDMGERVSVYAPFFNIPACSVNILPKLSQRTDARWIPVFVWRNDALKKYQIHLLPEIKKVPGDSDEMVMTKVNAIYEKEIRKHPEQYFWVHRRFKNSSDDRVKY